MELIIILAVLVPLLAVLIALVVVIRRVGRGAAPEAADGAGAREGLLNEREARLNRVEAEQLGRGESLARAEAALVSREAELRQSETARADALAEIAALTPEQARVELLAQVEREARLVAAQLSHDIEAAAQAQAEASARRAIVTTIQRVAAEQTNESAVAVVTLPSDDLKGRLIGKDGRNIRSFEQVTGANLLIDDTPGTVLLSCFDPLRREIARLTLIDLIADGRIHPGRIEDVHARNSANTERLCVQAAESALSEMGITDLNPALLPVLGSLKFRTSYGQNVLAHLVECGHIAATLAAELGVDVATCRRAAFLHDLGKAVVDESGSHAMVGAELARRYGEHPDIVHAIEAHHNEVEPTTVEAILTQAADSISASRPGARRESLEAYVQRLEKLEKLAGAHPGVTKVYAMQAGREVRVLVAPEQVTDADSLALAREIARQVEAELSYPGNIHITVVRESRATAVAR
ncbi:ribonuclease Y [Propionicimonas sp.]|uniref:ribonuclease Y n=1 Tax=Propionicimonas sp. TaxID=1955623 RepID=UPI001794CB96|nr:ribonuclease Y [Propionicimonas sp.]MBU3977231.1 ribonuclease Y [Actinomycetota bacterium]MBA3021157.1 ribonuclease Y [Propionicimonas sp.]MBU3985741.1 ribonuclease Y [Actinomycetota bacterium]MBU4008526.1 ribonuclease Y [Actinomycetota bacterium]MBU4066324.1 ribonuclease Y [Actinomycetota bacterium]